MTRVGPHPEWMARLESEFCAPPREIHRVAGGDIAASYRVELEGRSPLFVKDYGAGPIGIGQAEARGLEWLREPRALRIPHVIASGPTWLALEWIDSGVPCKNFAEQLGSGLAQTHAASASDFGWEADNWIGPIPQRNDAHDSWADFYAACRLRPLVERAIREGLVTRDLRALMERVIGILPELIGPSERPARLHGDLWSGNVLVDETGSPCLIDPAPYGGHREVDLAMMRLFGGFEERVFEAYHEAHPLTPGSEERIALYQVYPLLVHVCLFGQTYTTPLHRTLLTALGHRNGP